MRAYVFTDKALARHAGRFVWLSIDSERPENAAFLEKYPISVWPTLLVLDAREEKAALKWAGGATVPQLEKLFEDGERAVLGSAPGLEGELARADNLNAEGKPGEAVKALEALIARAPPDWSRRPRAVESLLLALMLDGKADACTRVALAEVPKLPRSPSLANAAGTGLACALDAPKDAPGRKEAIAALEGYARAALGPPEIAMAADDRSGVYEVLVQARQDAGDTEGKKQVAREWATYLEGEAARAPNAEARAVFDSHRLGAYLALGEPARALPMLEASEKALPEDYNPPARLAYVLRQLGRYDEALAASDRALVHAYGPRKLNILRERANIQRARKDGPGTRKALEDALAYARSLPPSRGVQRAISVLEKELAEQK